MANFKTYTHVVRLDHPDAEGLLENDKVYVTPKIDGTNASVFFNNKTGQVSAGSRKRELNEGSDNASFYSWVTSNNEEACKLRQFVTENPQYIVYGEWLGYSKFIGHIKDYNSAALGYMYIFDVYDCEAPQYLAEDDWRSLLTQYGLEKWFVPILAVLSHPKYEDVLKLAEDNVFLLDNANHAGEGVVCKVPGWLNKFYHVCYGKVVLDDFKERYRKGKPKVEIAREGIEKDIVEYFVTEAELSKTKEKVCVACGTDTFDIKSGKHIGMFLNLCVQDVLEEMPMVIKKFRRPIIDFQVLDNEIKTKGRKYLGLY